MNLTISFDPGVMDALQEEASARAISCEEVIQEIIQDHFKRPQNSDTEYAAWVKEKVLAGQEAIRRGDICSHKDVRRDMAERRTKFISHLS